MADAGVLERVLQPADWAARAASHQKRADALTAAHRDRAGRGQAHPVWDFLFTYYSLQPRRLRVWHPGFGVTLAGPQADGYLDRAGYVATADGVTAGVEYLRARQSTVRFIADLLRSTSERVPQLGPRGGARVRSPSPSFVTDLCDPGDVHRQSLPHLPFQPELSQLQSA